MGRPISRTRPQSGSPTVYFEKIATKMESDSYLSRVPQSQSVCTKLCPSTLSSKTGNPKIWLVDAGLEMSVTIILCHHVHTIPRPWSRNKDQWLPGVDWLSQSENYKVYGNFETERKISTKFCLFLKRMKAPILSWKMYSVGCWTLRYKMSHF